MSDVKPEAGRVVNGLSNKTLKMSIGKKKLHEDPCFARMMYGTLIINGVQYCRPHVMIYCHICEVNNKSMQEEVNEERSALGLRVGGDPMFNEKADKWMEFITEKQMEATLKRDLLILKYGKDHSKTHPEHWQTFIRESTEQERQINDEFLKDVQATFDDGASQCCYYACNKPDADKLFRCTGCGIAKYCSKEHQKKDWDWEHKGECTSQVPQFIRDEIREDRNRNLAGNYDTRDRR